MNYQLNLLAQFMLLGVGVGLRDNVIEKTVTAIHGQSVVLECSFTTTNESSLENFIVVWQKETKVIHSYFYNKNRFSQDSQYAGRTSLFPEEFKNGNASLKLKEIKFQDSGLYQCYVKYKTWRHQILVSVNVAAYYDEPILQIKHKLSSCLLTFQSHGYPKADISWYNGDNLNRPLSSKSLFQYSEDGLYTAKSTMEIIVRERNSTYIFVLKNVALNQTISRKINLLNSENTNEALNLSSKCAFITSCILLILVILLVLLAYAYM